MARLPGEIDPFGENGEFHTLAKVWGPQTGMGGPALANRGRSGQNP